MLRGGGAVQHLLAYAGDGLAGYAQVDGGADASVEMVVDPEPPPSGRRQRPVGRRRRRSTREARVWAHGNLAAAQGFAAARGLEPVRELHKMSRPLQPRPT